MEREREINREPDKGRQTDRHADSKKNTET